MKCCGKYFFLVCILSLGSFKTTSQVVYIELEPYVALQFDKEIRNPEFSSPTKGLSYIYGVNSYLNITDYFGLKGGLAIRKEPLYSNMVGQLAANITFAHFQERTISLSVEFGMEYNEYKIFERHSIWESTNTLQEVFRVHIGLDYLVSTTPIK